MTVILAGMGTGAYETAFWCERINALTIRANKDCQAKKRPHQQLAHGRISIPAVRAGVV